MICQNKKCQKEHDGSYGSGKFCCLRCSKCREVIYTDAYKKKVSDSVKNSKVFQINNKLAILRRGIKRKDVICKGCKCSFKIRPSSSKVYCSRACYKKYSVVVNKNRGGYRQGSGNGKHGWYNGIWCDSSWELAYTIYNLEHNIPFERNIEKFKYTHNGMLYNYIPDYVEIQTRKYIEIKGYKSDIWKSKSEQFPHELLIIGEKEIQPYLDYAILKYGKKFIKMYDGYNPNKDKLNKCVICGTACKHKCCSRSCTGKLVSKL